MKPFLAFLALEASSIRLRTSALLRSISACFAFLAWKHKKKKKTECRTRLRRSVHRCSLRRRPWSWLRVVGGLFERIRTWKHKNTSSSTFCVKMSWGRFFFSNEISNDFSAAKRINESPDRFLLFYLLCRCRDILQQVEQNARSINAIFARATIIIIDGERGKNKKKKPRTTSEWTDLVTGNRLATLQDLTGLKTGPVCERSGRRSARPTHDPGGDWSTDSPSISGSARLLLAGYCARCNTRSFTGGTYRERERNREKMRDIIRLI